MTSTTLLTPTATKTPASTAHNKPSVRAAMIRATNEVLAELGEFEDISFGDLLDRAQAKVDSRAAITSSGKRPTSCRLVRNRHTAPTKANGGGHVHVTALSL
jgi:hypothetical protein